MENGSVVFRGTSSVDIRLTQPDLTEQSRDNCCRFDPSLVVWVARSTRYPQFLAHGKTDGSTLLLGPHQWTIYNDSKTCSPKSEYETSLSLSSCPSSQFTCASGHCTDMKRRCDGRTHCKGRAWSSCNFEKSGGGNLYIVQSLKTGVYLGIMFFFTRGRFGNIPQKWSSLCRKEAFRDI